MTTTTPNTSVNGSLTRQDEAWLEGLIEQIAQAQALQRQGDLAAARQLYERVVAEDEDGVIGISARKALEGMARDPMSVVEETRPSTFTVPVFEAKTPPRRRRLLDWFYNLPIRRKQIVGLFTSEVISVGGLFFFAGVLLVNGGRSQLVQQVRSELTVTDINYNIKINQMGFGFRGQSDNAAIIEAATLHQQGDPLSPALLSQVQQILRNEITARVIEYSTLVGSDQRIIASSNRNRRGQVFDPSGLVSAVLANPEQIRSSEHVSWEELEAEDPPLPEGFVGQDALIRYTATPVRASDGEVVGVLISGDIVNNKLPIVENTQNAFTGGYSAVYGMDPADQSIFWAAGLANQDDGSLVTDPALLDLADSGFLQRVAEQPGEVITERLRVAGTDYTFAAQALTNFAGDPVALLVRGTSEAELNALLLNNLLVGLAVVMVALLADIYLAAILGRSVVTPVKNLQEAARRFAQGDWGSRAEVFAEDEVGDLTRTFNAMADSIVSTEMTVAAEAEQRQSEATLQRQEKERLQQAVVQLLVEIEDARRGDLTVQASVDEWEMGSVADAFNATLRSLRAIVTQVIGVSGQVQTSAQSNEVLMQKLTTEANTQAQVLAQALISVEEMSRSIQDVASTTQEAAGIARQTLAAATVGEQTMDQTVESIDTIRSSTAETTKRVKRLAESSQEISKIVGLISGISEKTNLLAFNASIEAARAGEHGQGFRIVADEVRRLAERVTESAREIEQLVNTIQVETGDVLQQMEESNTHVVKGSQLVGQTKTTLQQLASISQKIDQLLRSISASTVSQAQASQRVTETMQEVAALAQSASAESQEVSGSLHELVQVASSLQASVSQFKVSQEE